VNLSSDKLGSTSLGIIGLTGSVAGAAGAEVANASNSVTASSGGDFPLDIVMTLSGILVATANSEAPA
jgi:hypothetical protein